MPKIKIKTATSTESTPVDSVVSVPIDNFYIGDSPVTDLYLNEKEYLTIYKGDTLKTTTNIQMAYTTLTEPNKVQIKTIKKTLVDAFYFYELDEEFKQTLYSCSLYGKPIDDINGLLMNSSLYYVNCDNLDLSKCLWITNLFYECPNLLELSSLNINNIEIDSLADLFYGCSSLKSVPALNTSNIIDMSNMFRNCMSLIEIPELDVSKADDTRFMFYKCTNLVSIPNLDTSNVTAMQSMFSNCSSLKSIPALNTSNVTSMSNMFASCTSLTSISLSTYDTSSVTTMANMFYGCTNLTMAYLADLNTSNVIAMSNMFSNCTNLTEVYLNGLDTSKVTNTTGMFNGCTRLRRVYADCNLDFSKVTKSSNMFLNCTNLSGNCGLSYDSSKVDVTYACILNDNDVPGYFTYFYSEEQNGDAQVFNSYTTSRDGSYYHAFIDTGITASSKLKIKLRGIFETVTGGSIIGAIGDTSETKAFRFFNSDNKFYLDYGSGENNNRIKGGTFNLNTDYTIEFGNRYVNAYNNTSNTDLGTVISGTTVSAFNYTDLPIHITHDTVIKCSLYFVSIYEDDVCVRRFIPCHIGNYDKGMYDMITKTYYLTQTAT